jgi:hypothetical protein
VVDFRRIETVRRCLLGWHCHILLFVCRLLATQKGLHRRLAKAPTLLMSSRFIILLHTVVKVGLQFVNATVDLSAKGDAVEFIKQDFVETLVDAIRLGVTRFCLRVVDILDVPP